MPEYLGAIFAGDPHESGGYIITESNFYRSRDLVMIKGGSGQLVFGTVLGLTGDGNYVPAPATSSDGSDVARAILFEDTDASGAPDVAAGVTARDAEVFAGALSYDASVVGDAATQAKWAQLLLVGIVVREQDDPAARAENNMRQTLGY